MNPRSREREPARETRTSIPEITIPGDSFAVVKETTGLRYYMKLDDAGIPSVLKAELAKPEEIDPEKAESEYIDASLELLGAMGEFESARLTRAELGEPEGRLDTARTRYNDALEIILDHQSADEILRINRQMRTQISNLGLQHIGEGTTRARGDVPVLDKAVRDEVERRELEKRQLGIE